MNNIKVAIIGGGYAGLSAAVELARADLDLTLFEATPTLGGRARIVEAEGHKLSNGHHVLLGAYTETMRLLRLLRVTPKTLCSHRFQLNMPGTMQLQALGLPAPLHLIVGILGSKGLSWADRLAALRLLRHLRKLRYTFRHDCTVSQFLTDTRQTPLLKAQVWEPICLAALNTPADQASAQIFANVLNAALHSGGSAAELLIPRIDMSELLPVPATYLVSRRGHPVRTATRIDSIRFETGRFFLDGDEHEGSHFSHVILATPSHIASHLLDNFAEACLLREQLDKIEYEAITTIYLAYEDRITLPAAMVQVGGSSVQTLFDCGQTLNKPGVIAAVIRGNKAHNDLTQDALALAAHKAVEQLIPRLPLPMWSKIIHEDKAAFACTPGLVRPRTLTPIRNLLLAGDYIESPYPANLESAVRSGIAAARHVIRSVQVD